MKNRAAKEGTTVSEYVTSLLRRDLTKPSLEEWINAVRRRRPTNVLLDIEALMDDVRGEPPRCPLSSWTPAPSSTCWWAPPERRGVAAALNRDADVAAPELILVEVASALQRMARAGELSDVEAEQAVADAQAFPVDPVPHSLLLGEAWRRRRSLRISDAFYVACARLLGAVLLTTDARLARAAGPGLSVMVVR